MNSENIYGDNRHLTSYIPNCELEQQLKQRLGNPDQKDYNNVLQIKGIAAMDSILDDQLKQNVYVKVCTCTSKHPFSS
jgi:hypothetical protein